MNIQTGEDASGIRKFPAGTLLLVRKDESGGYRVADLTPPGQHGFTPIRAEGWIEDLFSPDIATHLGMLLHDAGEMDTGACFYSFLHDETGSTLVPLTICRINGEVFIAVIGEQSPAGNSAPPEIPACDIGQVLPDFTFRLDCDAVILAITAGAEQYFGSGPLTLVGQSYLVTIHPDDRPAVYQALSTLPVDGKVVSCRYRLRNCHNQYRWVMSEFCGVFSTDTQSIREILSSTHDIDELVRAGEAARRTTEKLNLLNSGVRHDVINMVMGFLGYLEIINDLVEDEEARLLIQKEKEIGERIKRIMDMTRKYQGIGLTPPEWIDVNACVLKVLSRHEYTGRFVTDIALTGVHIYADRMFEHVIYELLANSIVAAKEKPVSISFSYEITFEGLVFRYTDNGPGICDEEKKALFKPVHRDRRGYGLYLVMEILDITGISIRETGEASKGARFEMVVPHDGYRIARSSGDSATVLFKPADQGVP